MPVGEMEGLLPAFGVVLPPGASLQGGAINTNLALDGPLDHLVVSGPINISNTRLAGFNLASKMAAVAALAGIRGGNETDIQTLASNLRIAPEGIHADNLQLVLPALGAISGSGNIGANNALDFHMIAKLAHGGGALGALSALSTLGQSKGAIPFLIQGTTSNPIFVPDVGKALGNTVTAPAQGVGGLLNGLFGHKQQQQPPPH
jgi:AsmA protein